MSFEPVVWVNLELAEAAGEAGSFLHLNSSYDGLACLLISFHVIFNIVIFAGLLLKPMIYGLGP